MEFNFDKFVEDIKKRENKQQDKERIQEEVAELDRQRRLRAELYHEKWQNRIEWRKHR